MTQAEDGKHIAETVKEATRVAMPELRWRCDPEQLGFETTAEIEPIRGVMGQEDAVEALRFGLEVDAPGQNIYVRGLSGTGRMTLISRLLEEIQPDCPLGSDRLYVHNFDQPDRPRLITLPRGQGRAFQDKVEELIDFIREELRPALSTEAMRSRQAAMEKARPGGDQERRQALRRGAACQRPGAGQPQGRQQRAACDRTADQW